MIQLMICTAVLSLFFPLMLKMTQLLLSLDRFPSQVQDQIGLAQLRRFLNSCPVTQIQRYQLSCENDRQWHLQCSANHLYLSPGTVVVLEGVSEAMFELRGTSIYLIYLRKNQWKEAIIAHV